MIFYVVYVKGEVVGDCLNAIRCLASPSTTHAAHITVRGPYEEFCDMSAINTSFGTIPVLINGVGRFINPDQHVVYLSCVAEGLEKISWRPDFPLFTPHLTLYSGRSMDLANEIHAIAVRYRYSINLHARELEVLVVPGRLISSISATLNEKRISRITGEDIRYWLVKTLSLHRRLGAIDRLCRHLSRLSDTYEGDFDSLTWDAWESWRKKIR